jgi:adenine-specific DNA-methyltransferase
MSAAKNKSTTPIEANVHKDRRTNIPTEELRGFVTDDENKPKKIIYPRDQSLDPQLVWKGKDEQDSQDLEVPAVPIYIQEKIHPKYLIEELRSQSQKDKPESQFNFFSDFNGIDFEQMVEFYRHDQKWSNRMILGDSLLVMTSLAEKEGLKAKVQMIYIDPPYGINFGSNWQASTRKRDVKDGNKDDATRQPEQIKAFRDTWKLGINSYLAYLRDRLTVSRELLTDTGSVFVQIGDANVHLVRSLLDEVFGSDNFVATIIFRTRSTSTSQYISVLNDYLLWYAKDSKLLKYKNLFEKKDLDERFSMAELPNGKSVPTFINGKLSPDFPEGTQYYSSSSLSSTSGGEGSTQSFLFKGKLYTPAVSRGWRCSIKGLGNLALSDRILEYENSIRYKYRYSDFAYIELGNMWTEQMSEQNKNYVVQTATDVIKRCILMTTDPGDLVLDPTCGSGTTACVAEEWGRRWITIDTSRVAVTLARTRMMSAKYPYYLLADTPEGVKKDAEVTGRLSATYKTEGDIRKGFVYKHVPHITLKSIANNPDIKEGMTRQEIDAAIARHAESETLYDQPYEDNKRVRVTGPFTVESLSPHRFMALEDEHPAAEKSAQQGSDAIPFETMILENLKKSGVQNTIKNERITNGLIIIWSL